MLYYDFKAGLARGEVAPMYRIEGEDKYWSELAYKDILALSSDLDITVLTAEQPVEEAIWGVMNFPMMAERKVAVIRDRKLKEADVKALVKYLEDPSPTGVIVLYNCEGNVPGAKTFTFDVLSEGELIPYVTRLAEEMGGTITQSAARKLVRYTEQNMTRIKNELIKLAPLGAIDDDLVDKYVEPSYSYRVFDFTDAIARGSYKGAYDVLSSLARNAYEYSPFFTRLTDQIRLMLHVSLSPKVPDAELAASLGVSVYPLQKARKAASQYGQRQLLAVLMKMYALEEGFKTGTISVENAMDLAIAEAIEARKK